MPRSKKDFDARLGELVRDHVQELVGAITTAVRQNMASELQSFLGDEAVARARRGRPAPARNKRVVSCIAPGCSNPSKGPRFHYLCETHKDAPKKDYEAWRKAKRSR